MKISTTVPPFYVEILRRLDPRLKNEDLIMRMPLAGHRLDLGDKVYQNRRLNNDSNRRWKPDFHLLPWTSSGARTPKTETKIEEAIGPALVAANSTRGMTPGIINPAGPDVPANRVPFPQAWAEKHAELVQQRQSAATAAVTNGLAVPTSSAAFTIEAAQTANNSQFSPTDALPQPQDHFSSRTSMACTSQAHVPPPLLPPHGNHTQSLGPRPLSSPAYSMPPRAHSSQLSSQTSLIQGFNGATVNHQSEKSNVSLV